MYQKQFSTYYKYTYIQYHLLMFFCFLWILNINAESVTLSHTTNGIKYSVTYENLVCLGDTTTLLYSVLNTNESPTSSPCSLADFVPDATAVNSLAPGLTNPVVIPPQPSGILPGGSFDGSDPGPHCLANCGINPSSGQGLWELADPFPNGITYTFTVTVTASQCGLQTFSPCICPVFSQECLGVVSILVIPHVQLLNESTGPVCQNNTITGVLPSPICTGNTACTGPTGPCTPFPFHYTVSNATGGSVVLLDATGGVFQFTPSPGFFGTGSFDYNVISDTQPPAFCAATGPGEVDITVIQSPIASNVNFTACVGTGLTGDLVPFVTGGSGSYTFEQTGPISCGSVTVNSNGTFNFTAPTGPSMCSFVYAATDTTGPNCVGTGVVTFNVEELPVAVSATISTCVGQPVTDNLTASGGTPPYTFSLTGGTGNPVNGTVTLNDAATGEFTFTPTGGPNTQGSFQFNVTDANGCISLVGVITININPFPTASPTSILACQNTQVTGNLMSLVTGGTGPIVFTTEVQTSGCGSIFIQSDGTYQFAPSFGVTGNCCFEYHATQGGCPTTGPNDVCFNVQSAPTATGESFDICPSGSVTGDLNELVLPPPPPGPVSFTGGPGNNGILNLDPSGPFIFTPTIGSGIASFPFQVLSALPCPSATQTVTVTVHPNPTVQTGSIAACSGTGRSGNLTPLVSGTPPFLFTGPITENNGTVTVQPNGQFTFTADPGATGGSFTFGVTDAFGCSSTGTELIVVNPSPTATGVTGTTCGNTQASGSVAAAVTGGTPPYFFSQVGVAVGGNATVSSTGRYTFTPAPGVTGGDFVFQATDVRGCSATGDVFIIVNPGPIASSGAFTGCNNGIEGNLALLVTGGNPPFTFTGPIGTVINGMVTINANGTFTFTPTVVSGQGSFNYEVTDSSVPPCTSDPRPVTISINQGPIITPSFFDTCVNRSLTGSLIPFVTGGLPPYEFFQTGGIPPCAATLIVATGGTFDFTPALDFTGPCTFVYEVVDNTPCTSTGTATVTVHENPIASNSGPFESCQLVGFTGNLNEFISGGTPPFSFTGDDAINGTVNISASGPFVFTPSGTGPGSFEFSATDFFGCPSNTGLLTFITDESPVLTGTSPLNTCQNTPVSSTVFASGSPEIQPFIFSIASISNGTGVITGTTPTSADFTFTPTVNTFPTPTITGHITLQANGSNDCFGQFPVIINIHQKPIVTTTGLGSCSPTLTGNLNNFVTGGVPPYTFVQIGDVTPPGCGTVIIDPAGPFVFEGPSGATGSCTFEFQVTESSISECSSTGAITVTVSQPPVVSNGSFCACFNTPVTGSLLAFVTGGTPPFIFSIIGTPIGGTVFLNPNTGVFTFKPNPGFLGTGSFQFQVADSNNPSCVSNIGTITIQVPCCPVTGIRI